MALNPSSQFTAANELAYKTPMYTAAFQTIKGFDTFTITDINPSFPLWVEDDTQSWTIDQWAGYTCVVVTKGGNEYKRTILSNTATTVSFNFSLPMGEVAIGDTFSFDFYEEFCTYQPAEDVFDLKAPRKPYISFISGGGYSVTPDEGSTSSSTLKIEMQDKNDEITQMIHGATGRLQKKKCVVKAGYIGLKESEMLTVFTGEVTDYSYSKDGSWTFSVSDSIRALNKNIFRGASAENENEITGNPIDLLISLWVSKDGDGTKGPYDNLSAGYGLDLPVTGIDIEGLQKIRDDYFPTTSVTFNFVITERISANEFFVDEIFKPLNMYPIVLGDGRFSARVYRPTVPPYTPVSIDENDIIDIPTYDGNLADLINEVQFSYNYDGDGFEDIVVYADANSINNRNVGDRTLEIESRGIKSDFMDADDFLLRSANRIFNRYATPPIKLSVEVLFKYLIVESGDIILVSNKFLPNLDTGNFDLTDIPMEVIKRTVDWKRGNVKLELLQTGYDNNDYAAISPELIVDTGINATQFTVTDVKDYEEGFTVSVWRRVKDVDKSQHQDWYHLEKVADDIEITNINGLTITTDSIGTTYESDMRIVYNDNGTPLTNYQQRWGRIDAGYFISP